MGPLGFHLEKISKVQKTNNHHGEQRIPSSRNLVVVSKRGMAVPIKNWKRPAMEELPVPCVPRNQVMPGVINKNRLWFWSCIPATLSLFILPDLIFGINPLYNGGTPYHVFPKGNDLSKED